MNKPSRAPVRTHLLLPRALAALTLSGCMATGGDNQPAVARGALGVPQGKVESAGTRYIKDESKVVVASFRVAFSQSVKASARSSALFSTRTDSVAMQGKLEGLEAGTYQAVTDAAYADFVAKLAASGLTVIEPKALTGSPVFGRLASVANPATLTGATTGDLLMFAPTGTRLTMFPGDTGVGSAFAGFDAASPIRIVPELIKEQQAGVLHVTYYVDFLNPSSTGNTLVTGGDAAVSMGQGLSVRAGSGISYTTLAGSRCVGYCPNANSSIKLGQATFSQQAYGQTKDVTNRAANAMGVVSGLLSGQGFSRKDIEIHADPERYRAIATQLLADANSSLTDAVKQAR